MSGSIYIPNSVPGSVHVTSNSFISYSVLFPVVRFHAYVKKFHNRVKVREIASSNRKNSKKKKRKKEEDKEKKCKNHIISVYDQLLQFIYFNGDKMLPERK